MKEERDCALLTPSEVAKMFRVQPKTVTRWARAGRMNCVRTLGGHRRFRADEIRELLGQFEEHGDLPRSDPDDLDDLEHGDLEARAPHP